MGKKVAVFLVVFGALGGLTSTYVFAVSRKPPLVAEGESPKSSLPGIHANGIVESYQANGENVNIYPEIAGSIVRILVGEGQAVTGGVTLLELDDSIQKANVEQLVSQAEAANALLDELRAQPRKESLDVARAQVEMARASLKTAQDALDKQEYSYKLDPESVSKAALDNAINGQKVAKANMDVVARQYDLTKAGAWVFDVRNQEKQAEALTKAYVASSALLGKYSIKAPSDGVVLSINATVGSFVSSQGAYDTYTQGFGPVVVMGTPKGTLAVRCYIDEILISRLPPANMLQAEMLIRGTSTKIPLEFVRMQPYVSPKIQLSNERQEKVDLRVLPLIFRFQPSPGMQVFPGELVDVYVGGQAT
jgi:HlyD family secretion protein